MTAVKFAHHFRGPALALLISEMARVARRRVVVLDIRRHWLAYWGFVAWSRVFTTNRLVRHDGPLSVLRGFTPSELAEVAGPITGFDWTVAPRAGFTHARGTENLNRLHREIETECLQRLAQAEPGWRDAATSLGDLRKPAGPAVLSVLGNGLTIFARTSRISQRRDHSWKQ